LEDGQLTLCFTALFHQCQITLHSMIVPVFSGRSMDGTISPETVRKSAEKVVSHAHSYKSLLKPYLYARGDITHVPPLVGYGAFITAMVLLTTEISSRAVSLQSAYPGSHSENGRLSAVEAILGLLGALRNHWRPLQYPVSEFLLTVRRHCSNFMGLQYEKLSASLQAFSASQPLCETAASESGAVARHSTRGLRLRSSTQAYHRLSVSVGIDGVVGGEPVSSVRDSSARSTRHLNSIPRHLANSPRRAGGASESSTRPAAEDTYSDPNNVDDGSIDSTSMPPSLDVDDSAWYSLSFAEAGIEQFAGYGPLSVFQQGWRSVS
jgi:hypothetical protein